MSIGAGKGHGGGGGIMKAAKFRGSYKVNIKNKIVVKADGKEIEIDPDHVKYNKSLAGW